MRTTKVSVDVIDIVEHEWEEDEKMKEDGSGVDAIVTNENKSNIKKIQ